MLRVLVDAEFAHSHAHHLSNEVLLLCMVPHVPAAVRTAVVAGALDVNVYRPILCTPFPPPARDASDAAAVCRSLSCVVGRLVFLRALQGERPGGAWPL